MRTFGHKCLIILDGYDEYTDVSGDKDHKDLVKMLEGRKLSQCSVLLTSRPHCISNIDTHFHTVVRINGFTREHSEKFAHKILNDPKKGSASYSVRMLCIAGIFS